MLGGHRVIGALSRSFSSTAKRDMSKVAVLGAAGGIGQPLSLLLKTSPLVSELSCYDIVGTPGVAADLSHVSVIAIYCLFCMHLNKV